MHRRAGSDAEKLPAVAAPVREGFLVQDLRGSLASAERTEASAARPAHTFEPLAGRGFVREHLE